MCYFRIMNRLDADMVCADIITTDKGQTKETVERISERIYEITDILDTNYGVDRGACSMGGYILYFPDVKSYKVWIDKIYAFYHINPEWAEFEDILCDTSVDGIGWKEKLFMLSSDDSITVIYPEEREVSAYGRA